MGVHWTRGLGRGFRDLTVIWRFIPFTASIHSGGYTPDWALNPTPLSIIPKPLKPKPKPSGTWHLLRASELGV